MSSRPELKLDWCSYEAAKFAVEHWHYSKSLPAGKAVHVGVWEDAQFVGALIFSRGASDAIGKPYGLEQTQIAELARVALRHHRSPVSRIISIALRMMRSICPGLRMLVSYADPSQNHHGGIYQAGGWTFVGDSQPDFCVIDHSGKRWHSRMVSSSGIKTCFGVKKRVIKPTDGRKVIIPGKHKYLMPLDPEMRAKILPLAKPYPKRVGSDTGDTATVQVAEGGLTPTPTLQI